MVLLTKEKQELYKKKKNYFIFKTKFEHKYTNHNRKVKDLFPFPNTIFI